MYGNKSRVVVVKIEKEKSVATSQKSPAFLEFPFPFLLQCSTARDRFSFEKDM